MSFLDSSQFSETDVGNPPDSRQKCDWFGRPFLRFEPFLMRRYFPEVIVLLGISGIALASNHAPKKAVRSTSQS